MNAVAATRLELGSQRRFRRYPEYRKSGIEWVGEIPTHWEISPVYARYEVALGKMLDAKRISGEAPGCYLRNVDVQWDAVNTDALPEMDFAPGERDRYRLRSGDILVCEGGEVGRTAIWQAEIAECYYQKALHRVRPRSDQEVPRFFCYLMYSLAKRGVFAASGNPNTINHLTAVQLKHYHLPFPSAQEQSAIALFLDGKTAQIDALTRKKERLIELLQEKRSALIIRAVAKGLDPTVPMKESGIDWLGEIPAHWTVLHVSDLATLVNGFPFDSEHFVRGEGTPLVRIRDLNAAETEVNYVGPVVENAWIDSGDIVVGMDGDFNVARWRGGRALLNQRMCCLRPRKGCDAGFMAYVLPRPLQVINDLTYSTTVKHLSSLDVRKIRLGAPGEREQRAIRTFLDRETASIDGLVEKVGDAIDRLKELRTALISAAVTGKIDVREEAA